ncbi:Imidazole glycerol phosphate synthase subunit HisH [bioreactor metagenome]|uniref:Imidazole glycerol phosphate synthase subunit HisH n=1 Tax=bioreactor metagenome TaxID=1076179 RepID=A0A644ZU02_9ZZZZ
MIAIIDYNTGNLHSISKSIAKTGAEFIVTNNFDQIRSASKVIMPGVGDALFTMQTICNLGLDDLIKKLTVPVLGICVGMQIMCEESEEGPCKCLGIFPNKVKRLSQSISARVPHIGWNTLQNNNSFLFKGIKDEDYVYFVHSYAPEINQFTISTTTHGDRFSAALSRDNFIGTQFHPEKSGVVGETIIENFIKYM